MEENENFDQLLESGDVDRLKGQMTNNSKRVIEALKNYDLEKHKINEGPNEKPLGDGDSVKIWKLGIPIQKKIVQSTVAFLVGKPIRLIQESENTEEAFEAVSELWKEMRMNSKLADLLTKYYSETECVAMFRPYRDGDADPRDVSRPNTVRCRIVALSESEDIYYRFDEYGTLISWARGYKVKTGNGKEVEHFDIETKDFFYNNKKIDGRWELDKKPNIAKKISMVLFTREEWDSKDVDILIERREKLTSNKAMNNDAMGSPILVLKGKVETLPDVKQAVKVVEMDPDGEADYLYPAMSVDLIKEEREDLKEIINYITDTPDFSMDSMKSVATTSGKAIELMFFPAVLKSIRNQIEIEELFDRMMEVIKNLLVKVNPNNSSLASQMKNLRIKFEFTSPLPENEADLIEMLTTATGGKASLSQEEAALLNPLTKDGASNWEKLKAENITVLEE